MSEKISKKKFLSQIKNKTKPIPKISAGCLQHDLGKQRWSAYEVDFKFSPLAQNNLHSGISHHRSVTIKKEDSKELIRISDPEISDTPSSPIKYEKNDTADFTPKRKSFNKKSTIFDLQDLKSTFKISENLRLQTKKVLNSSISNILPEVQLSKCQTPLHTRRTLKVGRCNTTTIQSLQLSDFSRSFLTKRQKTDSSGSFLNHSSASISPVISGNSQLKNSSQHSSSETEVISQCSPKYDASKSVYSDKENETYKTLSINHLCQRKTSKKFNKDNDTKLFTRGILNSSFQSKTSDVIKVSDWLTTIQAPSNPCDKNEATDSENVPNVKKLRSCLSGGLSEQIQNLQIKERSERVIWNHNLLKRKSSSDSLNLEICAVQYCDDLVVTRCISHDTEKCFNKKIVIAPDYVHNMNFGNRTDNQVNMDQLKDTSSSNASQLVVLFRKNMFSKLALQAKCHVRLHSPWQKLDVPHLSFPVILCTYFVEVLQSYDKEKESVNVSSLDVDSLANLECLEKQSLSMLTIKPLSITALSSKISPDVHSITNQCYSPGTVISLTARIQRIWWYLPNANLLSRLKSVSASTIRYIFLLQSSEGTFHELIVPSVSSSSNFWNRVITDGEGKWFTFHNIVLTNRFDQNSSQSLFSILKNVQEDQCKKIKTSTQIQRFCYQFTSDETCKVVKFFTNADIIPYYTFTITPLYHIKKAVSDNKRVSCICKVLYAINEMFYISDEFVTDCSAKYMLMANRRCSKFTQKILGSIVAIRDALYLNGVLQIDDYCNLKILFPRENMSIAPLPNFCSNICSSRLKKLFNLQLKHIAQNLSFSSKVLDIVFLKGKISAVNIEKSISWLECNFCHRENLIQIQGNANIFCEDCQQMATHPVLNLKLEVTLDVPSVSKAVVNVELHVSTIKALLKLENAAQVPMFSVTDVLGETIGPLLCYVKALGTSHGQNFHLIEIEGTLK